MSETKEVKERPILFSGPMVKAILAGNKTQTRRALKASWLDKLEVYKIGFHAACPPGFVAVRGRFPLGEFGDKFLRCPYGQVGDRLWVKETWRKLFCADEFPCLDCQQCRQAVAFRADETHPENFTSAAGYRKEELWRPSIFMPRWASRIQLEITEIRVERLNDISEADAKAEGSECCLWLVRDGYEHDVNLSSTAINPVHPSHCKPDGISYRNGYASIWESINGKNSWNLNPWVWVITFKTSPTNERSEK